MIEEERQAGIRGRIQTHKALRPAKPHKSGNTPFDISTAMFFDQRTGNSISAYNPNTGLLSYVPMNWKLDEHIFLERKQFVTYEVFADFRAFADVQWVTFHLKIAKWWNELSNLYRELNPSTKREQRRQSIGIPSGSQWASILESY